eukprot:TRINITY_DN5179_c1_g2_i1.p1 TRINITY_DN5179_c1_g2~~TRINITY_DN5179_c1_g2_i1.p1  ORF type:complete len:657 (+),score=157.70 TRINITY_DN5179_c1_g2_i1:71-2041(+)
MEVCQRLCRGIVSRALRDTDTPEVRRRKELVIPLLAVCAVPALIRTVMDTFGPQAFRFRWYGSLIPGVACAFGVVWPIATGSFTLELLGYLGTASTLGVILQDWFNASGGSMRVWPIVILIMDLYLAVAVPKRFQMWAIHMTGLWLTVDVIERETRLGVYEVPGMTQTSRYEELCDCVSPPCGLKDFAGLPAGVAAALLMLYADYFATRAFAEGLQSEKSLALASVRVADRVSEGLASFDLEVARLALAEAGDALPSGLRDSFEHLLANLASYLPYLPQSCLERDPVVQDPGVDMLGQSRDGSRRVLSTPRSSVQPAAEPSAATPLSSSASSSGSRRGSCPSRPSVVRVASPSPPAVTRAHQPQYRRASALARNSCDFLRFAAQADWREVSSAVAAAVEHFIIVVSLQGGVTDLLSGDHLSATFGAVKVQGTHRLSATSAAAALSEPLPAYGAGRVTVAVCTGRALCGDFGSDTAQRFMVIGGLSAFLPVLERAAAAWGLGTLIDSGVQEDAQLHWDCRLRSMVLFPKLCTTLFGLWEVVGAKAAAECAAEWMYELQTALPNPWEPYNKAFALWCSRAVDYETLAAVSVGLDTSSGAVKEALLTLRSNIQMGLPPPVGELAAAPVTASTLRRSTRSTRSPSPAPPSPPLSGPSGRS